MLASDLQVSLPLLNRRTSASAAARLLVHRSAGGVVVADDSGDPVAVLSPIDVLRLLIPAEEHTVGDLLDDRTAGVAEITHVDAEDPLDLLADKMASEGAQIAVIDRAPDGTRFVTLPTVMEAMLVESGTDGAS
jgi:hypothetical protein